MRICTSSAGRDPVRTRPRGICGLVVLALGWPAARAADDAPPVTPYRPSVSNPAQLPAPGQLELELGGLRQRSSDARQSSLPYLLKLAWSAEWGVLVGGDAAVWQHDDGGGHRGVGDTNLTLKRAWSIDDATAFGLETGVKLPTAGSTIGTGRTDIGLNGILSRDLGPVHLDANLNLVRLGLNPDGGSRWQTGGSVSVSMPITDGLAATAELSGQRTANSPGGRQTLVAFTWSPNPRLAFDLGVARADRPVPRTTSWFAGVVLPLARLW